MVRKYRRGQCVFHRRDQDQTGCEGFGRRIISGAQGAELREAQDPYQDHHFGPKMVPLGSETTIPWHVYDETTYS